MTTDETRRELHDVESTIARLTAELRDAEGQRDTLLAKLLDNAGAHDQRPVGAR